MVGMIGSSALPRSTPEEQGVDRNAVDDLFNTLDAQKLGLHSLMVLRRGVVIGEGWWHPYRADVPHTMFSVSKSFVSTAVGIALMEGRLDLDEPILSFFPSYATPEVERNVDGLLLRHLLSMSTGHVTDTMRVMRALPNDDWVKLFLEVPIVHPPGSRFLYNSGASFMLAAVVASRTGQRVIDYLRPRLFDPLGIETPEWQRNARGIELGASGLRLRTEDLAKFSQLYLQGGVWNGHRIVTENWVRSATSAHVSTPGEGDTDWSQGYGFQFWRSLHSSYRADGAYGQFGLVVPELELVVAITAGTARNTDVLPVVWDALLPGVLARSEATLPASPAAPRLLSLPCPIVAKADSARAIAVNEKRIDTGANSFGIRALSLSFSEETVTLVISGHLWDKETHVAGRHDWVPGRTALWPYEEMSGALTANIAGWVDEDTVEFHQQCVETPFCRTWRIRFEDSGAVVVKVSLDLGFWDASEEEFAGLLA